MPNWCDCTLTITGPNRQSVLDKIKGDKPYIEDGVEYTVYFDVEKVVPRPKDLGDNWKEWSYENWGCKWVSDMQRHESLTDADVILFYTPWNPPLFAIQRLSLMFPENSFLLEDTEDSLPAGTTLFRKGKCSRYYSLPNYNSMTGRTATLYEIFCAVLRRTVSIEEAKKEVAEVKAKRLGQGSEDKSVVDDGSEPALNAEVEAIVAPRTYKAEMIPGDEANIAQLIANPAQCAQLLSGQY